MTNKTRRGVLIGCGFFADNHMHAWTGIDGVEIVAVCDLDGNKANAMAARHNIAHAYTDADAMLGDMQPDFVDVATTAASHRPLVELACRHGAHVICQKPFAENMADAQSMVAAAKSAGVMLVVHENFRWQKGFIELKKRVAAGAIGDPHFARFSFRHGYDNYKNQPYLAEIERFTIMDVGLHLFDLARHFLGDVETIACNTQRLNPIVRGEDAFTAMLRHEGGATSICDCSFYTKMEPDPFPQTAAWIEGDAGSLELTNDFQLVQHAPGRQETIPIEPEVPHWGARPWHNIQDSVIAFQTRFIAALNGSGDAAPTGEDNLKTLALAFAAYEAAENSSVIALSR